MEIMEKKKIFNSQGSRGTESLLDGNTTNLREWNRVKYDWTVAYYRGMLNNFWIPEEIGLGDDLASYKNLTDEERNAVHLSLSFLNFLDSLQSSNLPVLSHYLTAPEVASLLNIQAFQEEIHAQSYSYIIDTVISPEYRPKIYDLWREDKELAQRNEFIAKIYNEFNENSTQHNFIRSIMANYILEGIYFYSGFSLFYTLAKQGKLSATSTIFQYINRDEDTHIGIFRNIITTLQLERPELFTSELKEELREMMRKGVENEIRWGQYITNNKIIGITNKTLDNYIKFLSNKRLRAIGLEVLYPEVTKNEMEWVDSFANINNNKVDFFEKKPTAYVKASGNGLDDLV